MTGASPEVRTRWSRRALAAAGGFLVALSLPPWGFWPLAFVGVAIFSFTAADAGPRRRDRAWFGAAFAIPWMSMGMGWMWFLTPPGYVVAVLLFVGLHAGAALFVPSGPWATIARPAAHTLAEVVRITVPFGGVPLATLGIAQSSGPLLVVARLGGVMLLTWLVFQIGVAMAAAVRATLEPPTQANRPAGPITVAALAASVAVIALSVVVPGGSEIDRMPLTIAAVQGGGEQGTTALDVPASVVFERHLETTRSIEVDGELDLVVWPENGIDVNNAPFAGSDQQLAIAAEAQRLGVPFAVGVTVDSEFSLNPVDDRFVNAQAVVGADGEVGESYEKVQIVPFGEYVPLRGVLEAFGAPLDQIPNDAIAGRGPAQIALPDGIELGVMISWEVFFGERGRAAADGAVLLNPTNGASYTGTVLQTQQVASSRLRAMETGRWVVQVSPTGFSAFVSPDGDVFDRTDVSERAIIVRDIPLRSGTTAYTWLGDWPWMIGLVLLLGAAWWFGPAATARRTTADNE